MGTGFQAKSKRRRQTGPFRKVFGTSNRRKSGREKTGNMGESKVEKEEGVGESWHVKKSGRRERGVLTKGGNACQGD